MPGIYQFSTRKLSRQKHINNKKLSRPRIYHYQESTAQGICQYRNLSRPGKPPNQESIKTWKTSKPGIYQDQGNLQTRNLSRPGKPPNQESIKTRETSKPGIYQDQGNIQTRNLSRPGKHPNQESIKTQSGLDSRDTL